MCACAQLHPSTRNNACPRLVARTPWPELSFNRDPESGIQDHQTRGLLLTQGFEHPPGDETSSWLEAYICVFLYLDLHQHLQLTVPIYVYVIAAKHCIL